MPGSVELREFACPSCGARTRLDVRFVRWCPDCGHGADPNPPRLEGRAGRRAAREQARALRMFESLRGAQNLRPSSASGTAVEVLSALVHLVGLAALVLPVWAVLATGGAFWADVLLLIGALTFWSVRPRLQLRIPQQSAGIAREQAPKLYALLDRCAAELDCAAPDQVLVDRRFNASTARIPFRRHSLLTLGMPLWTILSGPERIALLGHELGHQVNGDPGHGTLAASARRSLRQWMVLLNPRTAPHERRVRPARGSGIAGIAVLLAPVAQLIVFLPCYLVAWGCEALLTRLDLSCGQRAEYLADELGARLGGSEAAGGLLGKLPLGEPAGTFLLAKRNTPGAGRKAAADQDGQPDLWESLRAFVDSIPETERQRRKIVDKAHNTRTDSTHPANHLRASLMHERPQHAGTIKLSEEEWAEIDAELAPASRAVAKALLGRR